MPLTHSSRERRLWWTAAALVALVWSSIFTAGALRRLQEVPGLLEIAFSTAFLLFAAGIAVRGWARGDRATELWLRSAVVIAAGMWIVRSGLSAADRTHVFEFGLIALVIDAALRERSSAGRSIRWPGVWAILMTASLGWLDEGVQALHPNRVYDLRDVGVDAAAAVLAVGLVRAIAFVAEWVHRRRGGDPGG